MEVQINMAGVLLGALAAMVVGGVWYAAPVFGKHWKQLVDLDEKRGKREMPRTMAVTAVLSLLMSYVVAHVTYLSQYFYGNSFQQAGILTGFWLWLGIAMTMLVTGGLFEQRPAKLIAINAGNQLLTLLTVGAVIGAVGV